MFEAMGGIVNGVIAIAIVLGACIFFHEVGHFVVAKIVGMRVHEFAIGFGKRIVGFTRGDTEYRVNLIPLGGYVRIAGMEPGAEPEVGGFYTFARWKGAIVLFAGSFMNVVLAALAFILVAIVSGVPVFPGNEVGVSKIIAGSPAAQAGIEPGDEILAIDGMTHSLLIEEVHEDSQAEEIGMQRYDRIFRVAGNQVTTVPAFAGALIEARSADEPDSPASAEIELLRYTEEGQLTGRESVEMVLPEEMPLASEPGEAGPMVEELLGVTLARMGTDEALGYISSRPEQEIVLTVLRDGEILDISVLPRREWARVPVEENGRVSSYHESVGRIGVVLSAPTRPVGAIEAVSHGVRNSVGAVVMVSQGIYMMISGQLAPEASGPVGIAAMTADRARIGWTSVASLGGIISANLAVINLFPIPPFDGFRIVLLGIEGVIRRRVNHRIETIVTIIGVALLLSLFLVITFRDIFNLVLFQTP